MSIKRLRPSLFPNCPPYLTFIGPGEKYDDGEDTPKELKIYFTVAKGTSPLVVECLQRFGVSIVQWEINKDLSCSHGPFWDHLVICEQGHQVEFISLPADVKINTMPAMAALDRKDRLWDNYRDMQEKVGKKIFNFIPKTYNLPQQDQMLKWKMKKNKSIWIVKPPGNMCGNGIRLVTEHEEVLDSRLISIQWKDPAHADILRPRQNLCVQKYITNPFLVNGLKFDLRLYVLLTNIDPIKVYLYEDGLVRFATKPFSMKKEDLSDKFAHLTNYSVNKANEEFIQNTNPAEFDGHKWSLKTFWRYMESQGHNCSKLRSKIKDITVKSILCGHTEILESYKKNIRSYYNCYKLFGLDIFIDDKLKPWLLELNNFPSLCTPSLDRHVNEPMIAEMFNIVGFQLTNKMTPKQKADLAKKYSLEGPLEYDNRLYTMVKSEEEKVKEEQYGVNGMKMGYNHSMVQEDKLTGGDVRKLIRAEEELAQTKGFLRLLPSNNSDKYLDYLSQPSYSDRLLCAWEQVYAGERERGKEVLRRLCLEGKHLN